MNDGTFKIGGCEFYSYVIQERPPVRVGGDDGVVGDFGGFEKQQGECSNQKQVASHSQAVRAGCDHKSVALEFAATEFLLQQTLGV